MRSPRLCGSTFVPTLLEEVRLRALGYRRIAGVDEAGRGPLAGPVVAAAVLLPDPEPRWWHRCQDSKLLTAAEREDLFERITAGAPWATGIVDAGDIDRESILWATLRAMRLALEGLDPQPDGLLVDALTLPDVGVFQRAVIKGDRHCLSIAAASIVAKVTRDRIMVGLDSRYPEYGFARHKGYGTAEHLAALARLGPCPIHRRSFNLLMRGDHAGPAVRDGRGT
ncbi:MAG: ribonuclease HII [Chloroflexi bacterium]|nr:ribonuclease HII [Chloroflexota bacterium]